MIRFFKSEQGLIGAQVLPPLKGEDKVINGVFQFFSLMSLQSTGRIGRGGLRIVVKGFTIKNDCSLCLAYTSNMGLLGGKLLDLRVDPLLKPVFQQPGD